VTCELNEEDGCRKKEGEISLCKCITTESILCCTLLLKRKKKKKIPSHHSIYHGLPENAGARVWGTCMSRRGRIRRANESTKRRTSGNSVFMPERVFGCVRGGGGCVCVVWWDVMECDMI
jgi:hypothetical protein